MVSRSTQSVDVRRAAERGVTVHPGIESRHGFSFGHHHEPGNTHHGLLLAYNEDRIAPGAGYDTHSHRDTEIVTWVVAGSLAHADSEGHAGELGPGWVQRVSAGSGIEHSERHAATDPAGRGGEELHLVQMWLLPDTAGTAPRHQQRDLSAALDAGKFVTAASGLARDAGGPGVWLGVSSAALHIARPPAGRDLELPGAEYLHIHVVRGAATVTLDDAPVELRAGDAARLRGSGRRVLSTTLAAEVLVWEMHAGLGG